MTMSSTIPKDSPVAPPPLPRRGLGLPDVSSIVSRPLMYAALALLVATFFLPPRGLGIGACAFKELTGIPCMGCGMTRAVTNLSQGRLGDAWGYHPFVFVAWPAMVLLAAGALVPAVRRWLVETLAGRYAQHFTLAFWVFAAAFVVYGVVRMLVPGLRGLA